jgi:hypothetical protein
MATISQLGLAPLHRPGSHRSGGISVAERWTWDFVVDGQPLSRVIRADVAGALGWGDAAWEASIADKLLRRTDPDLPPDRIALYVCPECGDLSCGALTAAVAAEDDTIVWHNFRWERDWEGAPDDGPLALGPFRFDRGAYTRLLQMVVGLRPGPGAPQLAAS